MDDAEAAIIVQKNLRGQQSRRRSVILAGGGDGGGEVGGGFIRVCLRVRPLGEGRGERGDRVLVQPELAKITITGSTGGGHVKRGSSGNHHAAAPSASGPENHEEHVFDFERVCDERDDNASMAKSVGRPLVEAVCVGYNGTLFAYGQTGSRRG